MRVKKPQHLQSTELAGIQYMGLNGITSSCLSAITCLINGGKHLKKAHLISHNSKHAFLIITAHDEIIAIKSGFSSGYSGEGPRGLAIALALLNRHKVEIEECRVDSLLMERLDYSCLLQRDVKLIQKQDAIRPSKWHDYAYDQEIDPYDSNKRISRYYPSTIPFSIIDERIMDLAVDFHGNEDASIISAYRRLEDVVRKRTSLPGESTKLFSKAFLADDRPLSWDVPDEGEAKGRANLFNATYMAFRNARVHREKNCELEAELREFLLVNELYKLEAEALTDSELTIKRAEEDALKESRTFPKECPKPPIA